MHAVHDIPKPINIKFVEINIIKAVRGSKLGYSHLCRVNVFDQLLEGLCEDRPTPIMLLLAFYVIILFIITSFSVS